MENEESENKDFVHYNHILPSRYARWTARESFQFMYSRPWHEVQDFYYNVVNGRLSISNLFRRRTETHPVNDDSKVLDFLEENDLESFPAVKRSGRWARKTFKIVVSYHGGSFDGWQKQPGLNTVQEIVEGALGRFVDDKKAKVLQEKGLPVEGCAVVAGRTDKGVTALQQVCSFYTWRKDVKPQDIGDAINGVAPGRLRAVSVSEVSRAFHPNFSAKWRRYLYIFPLNDGENSDDCNVMVDGENGRSILVERNAMKKLEDFEHLHMVDKDDEDGQKQGKFDIDKVNQFLQLLEGKLLSYKMFARDTKASRNTGPPTECFLYHARAGITRLKCLDHGEGRRILCVELIANRFLRKMVRVLVATSIREAAAGAEDDVLVKLMDATCRRATAPPAPPEGLCLVDVGYTDFDPKYCFIAKS